ncbi:hypothetical protein F5X96DRAFT_412289 [Biscogniauxia mediterranea]|nr:hypothetical protein F5X96DRAFT_412289 [Biscogniauxia mediterranea]
MLRVAGGVLLYMILGVVGPLCTTFYVFPPSVQKVLSLYLLGVPVSVGNIHYHLLRRIRPYYICTSIVEWGL